MPQTPNRRRSRRTIVKSRRRKRRTRVRTRKSDDQLDFEEGAFSPFNRRRQGMYIGSKKKRKKSKRKKKKGKKKKGGMEAGAEPEPAAEEEAPGDSGTDGALSSDPSQSSESNGDSALAAGSAQRRRSSWARPVPPLPEVSLTRADRLFSILQRRAEVPSESERPWLDDPLTTQHLKEIGIFLRAYQFRRSSWMLATAVKYLAELFPSATIGSAGREIIKHVLREIKIRDEFSAMRIEVYMRVQRYMVQNRELREEQIRWHFIFLILLCMVPMYINININHNINQLFYNHVYSAIIRCILEVGKEEAASERIVRGRRIMHHDLETLWLNWVPQQAGGRVTDAVRRYLAAASTQETEDLIAIGFLSPPPDWHTREERSERRRSGRPARPRSNRETYDLVIQLEQQQLEEEPEAETPGWRRWMPRVLQIDNRL